MGKRVLICMFFISLTIPTSAFASDQKGASSNEDAFLSNISKMFSYFQTDKEMSYANYDAEKYFNNKTYYNEKSEDDWHYIGDKKINKKDWEKYLKKKKHPPKCEKESRDIWRKWFCYDDGWDDEDCDDDDDEWWKR